MVSMKTSSSNLKALAPKPILWMRLISQHLAKMLIIISRAGFAKQVIAVIEVQNTGTRYDVWALLTVLRNEFIKK